MKIVVLRENLVFGLSVVERAVGVGSNLPILKNVLFSAHEGIISLTATNLEIAVTHNISGKVLENGEITCPFQILNAAIKNVAAERIALEQVGKKLAVSTDNYDAQIQTQDPKEYPLIPSVQTSAPTVSLDAASLTHALSSVIVATQYTDIRPEISGVLFRFHEEGLTLVATDSFRLAEFRLVNKGVVGGGIDAIVPLRAAEEVLRIIQTEESGSLVEITLEPNQVLFKTSRTRLISRLIDGRFPEYHAIIPKEVKHEAVIAREEFARAVRATSSFAGRASDVTLTVSENKKFLELSSSDAALGEGRSRVPIKIKGEKFSAAFNWRYFLDGLKIYQGPYVKLGMNAPDRPVVISDPDAAYLTYVVMPIKT
ncbi:MAG: DNA polymerase III subunit beta [Candidatus Brennerbacteria bacterium]|nr:DNA polymerase III subunit beta [Candidatus Brennerbacteria bacterium]